MEVATDGAGVPGVPHHAHPLPRPDPIPATEGGRPAQVGVEVTPVLSLAVDQEEVSVEDRVEPTPQDPAGPNRHETGPAGGDNVEPFVGPAAVPRRSELADRAARPVRAEDREDMAAVFDAPVACLSNRGKSEQPQRRYGDRRGGADAKARARPQWCSITRSTRLYSFASSALMK